MSGDSRNRRSELYDNQNYFQLACIQSSTLGYPGIIIGQNLASTYGVATAIMSIAIGNLVAWLIGIAIISMVDKAHSNAIDNVKSYIGKAGGLAFGLVLFIALINWYAQQINSSISALNNAFSLNEIIGNQTTIKFGASLGLLIALLSIGGIRLLRKVTVCCFPIFLCYTIYEIIASDYTFDTTSPWTLSLPATLIATLVVLPGYINFPTCFRHSRSRAHSYLALSLITIFTSFFQISTIWMRFSNTFSSYPTLNLIFLTLFILLTLTCINLLNIYLASACLETVVPRFSSAKGYAIIGLFGTLTYTFLQISTPVLFIEDLTNSIIGILGIILLMAYILKIIVKHRPRPFEKMLNMAAWILGSVVAAIYQVNHPQQGVDSLLTGVKASLLFFLAVLFIEELVWATQKKWAHRMKVR